MTTRKTFSLPDDLARRLEREATSRGVPESTLVREGLTKYLSSSSSKLSLWVAKGVAKKPVVRRDLHGELVEILDEKHPRKASSRKRRP